MTHECTSVFCLCSTPPAATCSHETSLWAVSVHEEGPMLSHTGDTTSDIPTAQKLVTWLIPLSCPGLACLDLNTSQVMGKAQMGTGMTPQVCTVPGAVSCPLLCCCVFTPSQHYFHCCFCQLHLSFLNLWVKDIHKLCRSCHVLDMSWKLEGTN